MTVLNPYLSLRGNAREALEFYQSVFGGDLTVSTFRDFQMPDVDPAEADNVMHGQLAAPGGLTLMASDVPAGMPFTPGNSVTISLSGADDAELRGFWNGLSVEATVNMPLEPAPWGDSFGQLVDKFGFTWMVNIAAAPE